MFEYTTFFVLLKNGNNFEVKRLILTRETQEELCNLFGSLSEQLLNTENEFIEFDGRYKPDNGEIQYINNFEIGNAISSALREPTGVEPFVPNEDELIDIKGIFTGVVEPELLIVFQKFNKSQLINRKGINLFHNQNTFEKLSSFGISILENIDCVYSSNKLYFFSYLSARQIFNLSDYYRIATDGDINSFANHGCIHICNKEQFGNIADSWVRRKIALISDSGVLENFSASQIAEKANQYNLVINLAEQQGSYKISMPDDKKEVKNILKFLDEDIYRGPLSNNPYETNSKRRFR